MSLSIVYSSSELEKQVVQIVNEAGLKAFINKAVEKGYIIISVSNNVIIEC